MAETVWRARPVFITSTFRDMHAERDYLRDWVFPIIDERLRERREYLELIDLRQGVETLSEPEQHARELQVLKVCLDEVKRSRPFLIGLLGDRYGWIPPEARIRAAAEEAGFEGEVAGRSVTELEIAYGVLADPEQRQRSLFYFRDPLPYDEMPREIAAQYSEKYNKEPIATEAKAHLDAFKEKIRQRLPGRWHNYSAEWDEHRSRVVGLKAWGEQVVADLWHELDAETADSSRERLSTWQSAEQWTLEQFIEERSRTFSGRKAVLDRLYSFATSPKSEPTPWCTCLVGGAGSGKSAVFAQLYRQLSSEDVGTDQEKSKVLLLAHSAGISPRSVRVDDMLARWVDELSEHLEMPNPLDDVPKGEDVEQAFSQLLGQASLSHRIVILVDALDQLENTARARQYTWLPEVWPPNVCLIATAIAGTATKVLSTKPGVSIDELEPLLEDEAGEIAASIYGRYHRSLNAEVKRELLGKRTKDGLPAWGNPLWLGIATEALNQLDEDDYALADKEFGGEDPVLRLQLLVLYTVDRMPGDVAELYSWVLERAQKLHGSNWTRAFMSLIAISRSGWREQDFAAVMPGITGEQWSDLKFAAMRRTLKGHIVQRGSHAQWQFSHVQMREAVIAETLVEDDSTKELHATIAAHLQQLPSNDPLHERETMVHLIGARDITGVARYYGSELTDDEAFWATDVISEVALRSVGHENGPSKLLWLTAAPTMAELPLEERFVLCRRFIFDLDNSLERHGSVAPRLTILEAAQRGFHELVSIDPAHTESQRGLLIANRRRGDVYALQGRYAMAIDAFRSAIDICENAAPSGDEASVFRNDHVAILCAISSAFKSLGDDAASYEANESALEIARALALEDPIHEPALLVCQIQLLDHSIEVGEYSAVMRDFEDARATAERIVHNDPTNLSAAINVFHLDFRLVGFFAKQGEFERALNMTGRSLAELHELIASDPENLGLLGFVSDFGERRGHIFIETQRYSDALDAFRESLDVADRIARIDPMNVSWQYKVPRLLELISRMLVLQETASQGSASGAIETCHSAMQKMESLVKLNPDNSEWRDYLSKLRSLMELLWRSRGDLTLGDGDKKALEENTVYLSDLTRWQAEMFVENDPKPIDAQLHNFDEEYRSAEECTKQGNTIRALEHYENALQIREQILLSDSTDNELAARTAALQVDIGDLCLGQGNVTRAIELFSAAEGRYAELALTTPDDWTLNHNIALCRTRLGNCLVAQRRFVDALDSFVNAIRPQHGRGFDAGDERMVGILTDSQSGIGRIIDLLRHQRVADDELTGIRANVDTVEDLAERYPGNFEIQRALGSAHTALGIALGTRNEATEALQEFDVATMVAERLAVNAPSDFGVKGQLATLRGHVGVILERQGNLAEALGSFRANESILQSLAESDPGNPGLQQNLAIAQMSVARVLRSLGDVAGALSECRVAEEAARNILDRVPTDNAARQILASITFSIGEALESLGDSSAALGAYEECESMSRPPAAGGVVDAHTRISSALAGSRIGSILSTRGDFDGALECFRSSESAFDQLAMEDPANTLTQQNLGTVRAGIGIALEGQGDAAGALRAYTGASRILGPLVNESPGDASLQDAAARAYQGMANAQESDGQLERALESWSQFHELSERLVNADPASLHHQRSLFVSQWRIASVLEQLQRVQEAMVWWQQAYESITRIVREDNQSSTEDREQLEWLRRKTGENQTGEQ